VRARAPGWITRFGQFQIPDTRGVQHLGRGGVEGGQGALPFLPAAFEPIPITHTVLYTRMIAVPRTVRVSLSLFVSQGCP
jgi:hypothetical protein